mmetsp:Transcript_4369/g.9841  ORF Transcript_4369/g.9841 Transcript_4369/m.9841 type:complete len:98 (+) Transcript_4369:56-349(+)
MSRARERERIYVERRVARRHGDRRRRGMGGTGAPPSLVGAESPHIRCARMRWAQELPVQPQGLEERTLDCMDVILVEEERNYLPVVLQCIRILQSLI